ncbi:vacuolar fusion protein MON1 homolog A isoform X1 [Diabrotica virgifera virgifera]|uniref:Vacuolar fusion protein MON1 homolog n=1 Tax=Diabrotica virgifera virgifera TaxID=50390 RepID=A0ABM5KL54_DIAVI|nr:vacuolar fusion protein MON1 homolog A isoform X1 [Diabrotica virgifera virgifera]
MSTVEIEPGAAPESVLVTTDTTLDHFEQMSSSLEEIKCTNQSNHEEEHNENTNNENLDESSNDNETLTSEEDFELNKDWINKDKHVFVLSMAGKPIYSRYGNEDKLAWLFGVMQTLVSFIQSSDDSIQSIHTGDTRFVFLIKKPLILVAVSKTHENDSQLRLQLNYVFNQITSILTLTRLNKIYEQRQNYDLRRLLSGVERLIDHLLTFSENELSVMLGAVQCLSLPASVRDSISSAIVGACSKIKNLVFAILLANNKLITLVRMKKYCLHPADLHLIFNLVQASESFKNSESWTPLCLPRFDASGFLYGHVSYLSEDCQACLLLLTVERDVFFTLSEAKQKIVEKLRRNNCLESINESLAAPGYSCASAGFVEIRHYLYKCKSTAQFYQPVLSPPYTQAKSYLTELYKRAHQRLHNSTKPLKLMFERSSREAILAWDTKGFELFVVFEPLIDTSLAILLVGRLLNWIKKQEDKLFHLNAPTF